jgi:hypothetical protein
MFVSFSFPKRFSVLASRTQSCSLVHHTNVMATAKAKAKAKTKVKAKTQAMETGKDSEGAVQELKGDGDTDGGYSFKFVRDTAPGLPWLIFEAFTASN